MDNIAAMRAEVEAALHVALGERTELLTAHQAAKRCAEDTQHEFENFAIRVRRATRHGIDEITPAFARLLNEKRAARDRAAGAASLAKGRLANADWLIACRRADLEQLEQLARPDPERAPSREIVTRPPPPGLDPDDDTIVFAAGRKEAAA
jgi:hypothetical protein